MSGAPDPVLRETLDALRMSPTVLRKWLEDRRDFCMKHGGRTYYDEVLDLVEDCLALMNSDEGEDERC